MASLAGLTTDGLRRAALLSGAAASDEAGVLVLNGDESVEMCDRRAERWLDRLGVSERAGARLPLVISAVARQARALGAGDQIPTTRAGDAPLARGAAVRRGPAEHTRAPQVDANAPRPLLIM